MWWWGIAWATEGDPAPAPAPSPAPEEQDDGPDVIEIDAPDEPLGSAVDSVEAAHDELRMEGQSADWIPLPGNLLRGRLVVRPLLGGEVADGAFAVRAGGAVGHQWWTLGVGKVAAGGEELVSLTAPIGAARGRRLGAQIVAGPWLGPVGLRLGPTLSWDRLEFRPSGDALLLDDAVLVGGVADLSAALGPVVASVGLEPTWIVSGDRDAADGGDVPLPVLGDETTWRAGLGWSGRNLELSFGVGLRETAIGAVGEGTLGLRVRLL